MASDYERIRAENIREYGEGTRHLAFLGTLYTDRTHFIFELLQNAEDAGATEILFDLSEEKLEVRHNGRPFNENDVRGLCGVGEGTKAEDLTQIGRFGIGFKSVYAYTSTPEVHSGDEHFAIEQYVRPVSKPAVEAGDSWSTLFIFAFDSPSVEAATACEEIAGRLRNLNTRTLLFLRNLERVKYTLSGKGQEDYYRAVLPLDLPWKCVYVLGKEEGREEFKKELWWQFERSIPVPEQDCCSCVEIAFRVDEDEMKVKRITDSPLVAYFETEKLTHMGFLMQGPYRTTPARDNIPHSDPWNKTLVEETAILLVEALEALRDVVGLTISILESLPVQTGYFPPDGMFTPIALAVRTALMERRLLPVSGHGYTCGRNAKLIRGADLRSLLSQCQSKFLFPSEGDIAFLSEDITQDRTPELRTYLLRVLDIEELTPEGFIQKATSEFLESQSDTWFVSLYAFLSAQRSLWPRLRYKPIIRLQDGTLTRPFGYYDLPKAYLGVGVENADSLPIVIAEASRNRDSYQFLQDFGIPQLDLVARVVEGILPKYKEGKPVVTWEEHIHDISAIQEALGSSSSKTERQLLLSLVNTPFVLSDREDKECLMYRRPKDLYEESALLRSYFSGDESQAWISSKYSESAISFFKKIGLHYTVKVERRTKDERNHVSISSYHGLHERGVSGFDPDINVEGLEAAMTNPIKRNSAFIWNCIVVPNAECIRGVVERSTRKTYENSRRCERHSDFGKLLTDNPWLLGSDGEMHKPCDLALESLPEEFARDEYTARQLGMKKDVVAELAEEIGVLAEDIEILRQHPEEFQRWKDTIAVDAAKPKFPERVSSKPERRQGKIREQLGNSTKKTYENRDRQVRTSKTAVDAVTWLRDRYTNDDDIMVCQICTEEMPFRKRDGEYYFEAVEAFQDVECECEGIHLALCPLCAAKYKEFVKRDVNIMQGFRGALLLSNELKVPVMLGEDDIKCVHFVEIHLEELKTILETFGGNAQNI